MILSPRFGLFFKGLPVVFQLIIGTQCNRDLTLQIIFSLNITVRCCGLKICNIMKDRWGTISNMHKIWWLDPCCMLGLEEKYLILNNNLIRFYILSGQWWMWELKVFPQIPAEARITAFRWVFFCNCSRKKAKDIWFTVTSDKEMQQIFSPLKNQQMIVVVFSWNITQKINASKYRVAVILIPSLKLPPKPRMLCNNPISRIPFIWNAALLYPSSAPYTWMQLICFFLLHKPLEAYQYHKIHTSWVACCSSLQRG